MTAGSYLRPDGSVRPLAEVQREMIEHALQLTPHVDTVAANLRIPRTTLYRWLRLYGHAKDQVRVWMPRR